MVNPIGQISPQNPLVNQADTSGLPQRIASAIQTAADKTGVSFSYLMNKASQESRFDPNAKASTSSATGLFQFTKQTWLQMVKTQGANYGLGAAASQIQVDKNGVAHVQDPAARAAILNLRKDPQISAEMAGELDKQNHASLLEKVGGKIGATELYLAHFLGAGGASSFLNAMKSNPNAQAATVLPQAASANSSVFYASNGQPRSLSQIYQHFAQKFGNSAPTAVASATVPISVHPRMLASYVPSSSGAASVMPTSYARASAPTVMSSLKPDTSSLFATMVLAQMNIGNTSSTNGFGNKNAAGHDKSGVFAGLGSLV